ncbi:MAG: DsbA family oxidoreductase [Actinobacteria bacterium]|nr:DsbA family oxidoreductase [Actinomycetota bacterium]MCA1721296.1 DsbA family oxidoreductase [Actinomycetota bacterium]
MRIDIWSDVVCPWCYIGKRRLEAALADFHGEADVHWHAFELDPSAPASAEGTYEERLAAKYGCSLAGAAEMTASMTAAAAAEGLDFRFDIAQPGNTFDAHRLLHLAGERGVQDAVKERLLRATFTDGEPIGDRETLVRLVAEAGLDVDEARQVLTDGTYADEVRADEAQAAQLRITGVPFFVVDQRYGVSGAQPAEVLREVLDRAWAESGPLQLVGTGPGCDGDACAV